MYESKSQKPLVSAAFRSRVVAHVVAAQCLVAVSLGIGMVGYMALEALSPMDAFLNASMLLGGMGPVNTPVTWGGKLFAGCYALYAGLVFIAAAALIFTPVLHRVIHKFHWDSKV
jgi:hypothetical protein